MPLLAAVQDRNWHVRANAADVLAAIADPESAIVLYDMLCNKSNYRYSSEFLRALMGMGGEYSLFTNQNIARHIVAANHLTADHRKAMIELLRPGYKVGDTIYLHPLPAVSKLCEQMLHDKDESVRRGAATLLEAHTLLRGSQASTTTEAGMLLRAAQGAASTDTPDQLLRASATDPSLPPAALTGPRFAFWTRLWYRLFRRKLPR